MAAISADDNFKCIFLKENDRILIHISLKYVPRSPTDNKPALVQVMAWCRIGNKPLPELMQTHWCIYAALGGDELVTARCTPENYPCEWVTSYFAIREVLFTKQPQNSKYWLWHNALYHPHLRLFLTHWGWVMHICVTELGHHWFR